MTNSKKIVDTINSLFFDKWYYPIGFLFLHLFLQYTGVVSNENLSLVITLVTFLWLFLFSIINLFRKRWLAGFIAGLIVIVYVLISIVFGLLILFMDNR